MADLEVERRFALRDGQASNLTATLADLGFSNVGRQDQQDIYYTSKHKDFIASEECLRIRTDGTGVVVTWKPPSTDEMRATSDFWKEEIDLNVTGQTDVVRRLLAVLDFVEYVTVTKHRNIFVDGRNVEVALDRVEGVGDFLEIEVKSKDVDAAREILASVAVGLGLQDDQVSKVPYRDLVAQAQS